MDKEILIMLNARFDRLENKIDSALKFKWIITGVLFCASMFMSSKVTENIVSILK